MAVFEISLTEEERQATIMALAHLAVERPGWDYMLESIALKLWGVVMFGKFKELRYAEIKL